MPDVTRLDWIARVGFLARAVVYIMLGYIALNTRSKADEGQNAVFQALQDMPAGTLLLTLTAIGLFAYGLFRLLCAFLDLDGKGDDWKGIAHRAGQFFSAVAHFILGYTAWTYTSRLRQSGGGGGGGSRSEEAAQTILNLPMGSLLLGIVGVYFLLVAAAQARKAWNARFMREIKPDAPDFTCTLGRIGHAARAAVFAVIGWSIVKAGWFSDSDQTKELGGAIASLRDNDTMYVAVAAGLLVFGLFSLILARYRIVPNVDVAGAAKRGLRQGKQALR